MLGPFDRGGVDSDRDGDEQTTVGIDRRPVDRAAQRPDARQQAEQSSIVVDHRCERSTCAVQPVEGVLRRHRGGERVEFGAHHVLELGEPVEPDGIGLGEHPDRTPFVGDDDGTVCTFVDQAERIADRVGGLQRDRCLEDGMPLLDPVDNRLRSPRSGCPGAARRRRRDAQRPRPSAVRRRPSCSRRRAESSFRCRRAWSGRRRTANRPTTDSAP